MADKKYLIDNKELMKEWDWEKNKDLDPKLITNGSGKRAWWVCSICGHEWLCEIRNRFTGGTGCRPCSEKALQEKHLDNWRKRYNQAEEHYNANNNLIIPSEYICLNGFNLGKWIRNQREAYKKGCLDDYKIKKLNELDMVWNELDYDWDRWFDIAKEYYIEEKKLLVPLRYVTQHNKKLGSWKDYREILIQKGLSISGISPDGKLVEAIELPNHRFYVGVQFHPEFKSRPNKPHPLFLGLVKEASK